jgi:hypothetical protein
MPEPDTIGVNAMALVDCARILARNNQVDAVSSMTLALVTMTLAGKRLPGMSAEDVRRTAHEALDHAYNALIPLYEATK